MNKLSKTVLSFTIAAFIVSCGQNRSIETSSKTNIQNTPNGQADVVDNISDKDILKVAISSKDHTTLVTAIKAAHIEHVLSNAGPLTVFAPTNEAFNALPKGTVKKLLQPENIRTLTNILTTHAAPGTFDIVKLKKEAKKGRKIYNATGDYLEIRVDGDDVYINGCKIIASIPTSNGIVNVIDKVILL